MSSKWLQERTVLNLVRKEKKLNKISKIREYSVHTKNEKSRYFIYLFIYLQWLWLWRVPPWNVIFILGSFLLLISRMQSWICYRLLFLKPITMKKSLQIPSCFVYDISITPVPIFFLFLRARQQQCSWQNNSHLSIYFVKICLFEKLAVTQLKLMFFSTTF